MPAMVAHFGLGGAVFDAGTRALVAEGPGLWSIWPVTLALAFASAFGSVVHWQTPHTKRGESLSTTASSATASLAPFQIAGLWLLFALGAMSGLMYLALARTILADLSSGPGLASFAVFAIAIANMTGRLAVAWLQRALAAPVIVVPGNKVCVIALTGLLLGNDAFVALGFLAVLVAGYGVIASGMPLLTRSMLQSGEFGRVFPVVLTGWGAAGFLAPRLSAQLRDMTGDFDLALRLCLATSVAAVGERGLQDHGAALIADPAKGALPDTGGGDTDAGFAAASMIETTFTTATVLHFQMEPLNPLAVERDGMIEVHADNQ